MHVICQMTERNKQSTWHGLFAAINAVSQSTLTVQFGFENIACYEPHERNTYVYYPKLK